MQVKFLHPKKIIFIAAASSMYEKMRFFVFKIDSVVFSRYARHRTLFAALREGVMNRIQT